MQRTITRSICLASLMVCCFMAQPVLAIISLKVPPTRSYLKKACDLAQSKSVKIAGISLLGAGALAIIAARNHYPPQISHVIHNRFTRAVTGFLRNRYNQLRNFSVRETMTRATHALRNFIWPQPTLLQRVNVPVQDYHQADAAHLSHVPYFENNNNLLEEPLHLQNPHDNAAVTVQQVRTSLQGLGGGETCGYECIKNACGVAGLAKGLSGHHLLTAQAAQELFGVNPEGPLRQFINRSRRRYALINALIARLIIPRNLIHPLQNETEGEVTNKRVDYISLLRSFITDQINTLEQTGQITFNAETIRNYIAQAQIPNIYAGSERTAQEIENLHQTRVAYLKNPENIARYIRLDNTLYLTRDDYTNAIVDFNAPRAEQHRLPINGENLNTDEIDHIFEQERAIPQSVIGHLINNVQIVALELPAEVERDAMEQNEHLAAIRNAIANRNLQPLNRIYAIILRGSNAGTRNNGHLIAVVLEIALGGARRYTIIDSENNVQLFRGPAATCIRFLEGDGFNLRPTPARRQQLVEGLEGCAMHCHEQLAVLEHELENYRTSWGTEDELPGDLRQIITQLRRAIN